MAWYLVAAVISPAVAELREVDACDLHERIRRLTRWHRT